MYLFVGNATLHLYMNKTQQPQHDDPAPSIPRRSTVILMLATMADTTWRLFVPTIGGTVLGLVVDTQLATKPWYTAVGVTVGTVLAFTLVYIQVKRINRDNKA